MKLVNKYIILVCLLVGAACDNGFDEMNINPNALTSVEPVFMLNTAMVASAPQYGNLSYETTIVKQMITPFSGVGAAANFNQDNRNVAAGNWQRGYREGIKNLVSALHATEGRPQYDNLRQILRIWKAYTFMIITDTYGDVPYFEAGRVFLDGITSPVYDRQEDVYDDILKELDNASASINLSGPAVASEILYSGDLAKWKRFGYSLLLRAAMRHSKVNPTKAAEYVTKAVNGGLMQSNADNAIIRHTANFTNNIGAQLNGGQSAFFYLAEDFVSFLKDNNDPRLASIAVRYVGAASGAGQVAANANRNPDVQIGMPLGYDNTTISAAVQASGLVSLWDYSQLDRTRMAAIQAPSFLITYSQTLLLLAEAAHRGWTGGNVADLYARGIEAHMQQLATYGASTAVDAAAIQQYIQSHPLEAGKELEQINTQYWVSTFLLGPESWANFRRSGYPQLSPNLFPGSDLQTEPFIRRLSYTDAELNVNAGNVEAAIARQGPNIMDTRVWWDVK
ncbi:MAG: SusD/RagB family nutrient-binding outer membrane lipoprotein [Lunatimonas sp.]|uniref:SusD/RagB family nutrient-binding outer membrane lipoprotein n=1 Tax=Lunatimonas sp. TaxID=2060141 RepID=UPI00263AAE24|nr:SusD/RagB family nutrient-binding outer membrane lipoprotein [Lunatimonas sp.]MCC5938840.1 SusD/RagB family nutrient-binding outer membrane lipoprotein [Lunatimonas sp.]